MTPACVTAVRAWLEALNAGDADGVIALTARDVCLIGPRGTGSGHAALREWLGHAGATFETRATYAHGDAVVVAQRGVWRDARTGAASEADVATRFRVAGHEVAEVERYDSVAMALQAAGLSAADAITGPAPTP